MKKFLKILGILFLILILVLYLCFLFVLPKVVKLDEYKSFVQQIVKEQAHLDLDYGDLKVITTPLLGIGVKSDYISLKYEDGSELFSSDGVKVRVSLPSLLLMTIKVSCFEVENPVVSLAIEDGENLKILKHVDKILLAQEKNIENKTPETDSKNSFDFSKIRIKVPKAQLKNYVINAEDLKNKHNLVLKGDNLVLGYFNGKTAKLKTNAILLSDNDTKINVNIFVDTFLPPPTKLDEEDDKMQRAELPYANVVEIYRKYDLKSDINAKLKIREKEGRYKIWGNANVDSLTLKLANYILPESYAHMKFSGSKAFIDTNLSINKNQDINVLGYVKYDKKPKIDLSVNADKIYFKSFVDFAKGILDTFQIKNNLAFISVSGYIDANASIKTNFKKLKSEGKILVREGSFINKKTGLKVTNVNSDIILDNNTLNIKDSKLYIDNVPLIFEGMINEKSIADIKIKTDKLPLKNIYNTFAPYDIKNSYNLNSGNLSLDVNLAGKLDKAVLNCKSELNSFSMSDKAKNFLVSNENLQVISQYTQKNLATNIKNKNLKIDFPKTSSEIKNEKLEIIIDNENISLLPSKLTVNKNSFVDYQAKILNWQKPKKTIIDFFAEGRVKSDDLKHFAGKDAEKFIEAKGSIPIKILLNGNAKRQDLTAQILSDNLNYITPVNILALSGKQSVIQAKAALKGNRVKIKDTGIFEKTVVVDSKTNEPKDVLTEIAGIEGTIVKHGNRQFINLFTLRIPKDLDISITGLKNSALTFGGRVYAFGYTDSPRVRGGVYIKNIKIPELLTTLNNLNMKFEGRDINVDVEKLNLNGSEIDIASKMQLLQPETFTIDSLNIFSKNINVDKVMEVVSSLSKITPQSSGNSKNTPPQDINFALKNGDIRVENLKTGKIEVSGINSDISLSKNILYLNKLSANIFQGKVLGDIAMNLLTNIIHIKMEGSDISSDKALFDAANLKNMITGKVSFNTDFSMDLSATDYQRQMKSINAAIDFLIQNGQLGPFGRLENMILAENIRESAFFQTAMGGILENLTTIDTTHFDSLNGHVDINNAMVEISPIYSSGKVLNLYLMGKFDLLKNNIDMKVRAKLGSEISNMLGPIAALNPINLVKATPGLNIAMAKTFALFCEELSADEMEVIPKFSDKMAEFYATKFQIVLRGDVAKPLSLVKSFKWLATSTEIAAAQSYVASLPEPEVTNDGTILETQEEIEAYNKKLSTKIRKKLKKVFKSKKETQKA